jgi:hypothetical protein
MRAWDHAASYMYAQRNTQRRLVSGCTQRTVPSGIRSILRSRVTAQPLLHASVRPHAATLTGDLPLTPRPRPTEIASRPHRTPFRNFRRCNETPFCAFRLSCLAPRPDRPIVRRGCRIVSQAAGSPRHCRQHQHRAQQLTSMKYAQYLTDIPRFPRLPEHAGRICRAVLLAQPIIHARVQV